MMHLRAARLLPTYGRQLSSRVRTNGQRDVILNDRVSALERVRLVLACGRDGGEMSGAKAVSTAREAGLDVLQVARGDVPVVKLLRYAEHAKERRERAKAQEVKQEKAQKTNKAPKMKQVRLSPATDAGDRAMKLRQARAFLLAGHRVRLFMMFRRGHGKLRADAEEALCAMAAELVPAVGTLRGGADPASLREAFQPPPAAADVVPGGPRVFKPLEVFFEPLRKKQREAIVEKEKSSQMA